MTIRGYQDELRATHAPHFTFSRLSSSDVILYKGEILVRVRRKGQTGVGGLGDLPAGFHARAVQHIVKLLTGQFSALWDEQAVFGEGAADPVALRTAATEHAEQETVRIEKRHALTAKAMDAAIAATSALGMKPCEDRGELRQALVTLILERLVP